MGCMGPSVVTGLTALSTLVGRAGLQPSWLPGPALCGGCWPMGGADPCMAGCSAWGSWDPQLAGGGKALVLIG